MTTDCYSILGVPRTATASEIRAAYRRLARVYHPDLNAGPEAEARMREINEAYDTLSDPQRRRYYDRTGIANGAAPPAASPSPRSHSRRRPPHRPSAAPPARDFAPRQGDDITVGLMITPREAARGVRKTFPVERLEPCSRCRGSGLEPEDMPPAAACWRCAGDQRLIQRQQLHATIPAGVADGARLRLRGQGHAGRDGGPAGHIYITVRMPVRGGLGRALTFLLRHLYR